MNYKKRLFSLCVISSLGLVSLTACNHFPGAYTLPIVQGNELTSDSVEKVQAGMSQDQVRFLLGTPLIQDPFHPNRWDYVYYLKKDHVLKEKYQFTVYFENGMVSQTQGTLA